MRSCVGVVPLEYRVPFVPSHLRPTRETGSRHDTPSLRAMTNDFMLVLRGPVRRRCGLCRGELCLVLGHPRPGLSLFRSTSKTGPGSAGCARFRESSEYHASGELETRASRIVHVCRHAIVGETSLENARSPGPLLQNTQADSCSRGQRSGVWSWSI